MTTIIEPTFDHDRLDVYRLAIDYVVESFAIANQLSGTHRHARDQSIPLNIAQGNGKHSLKDRARFFDIARGSALECAAIQDVLVTSGGMDGSVSVQLKAKLKRIVSMLTRMAVKFDGVSEPSEGYAVDVDYEHEHRDAEYEHGKRRQHEVNSNPKPAPRHAPEGGLRSFTNAKSIVRSR